MSALEKNWLPIASTTSEASEPTQSAIDYKTLFNATFEGLLIHENYLILDANAAFLDLIDYPREEVIGHNVLEFITIESGIITQMQMSAGSEKPYEVIGKRRNGSMVRVEVRAKNTLYQNRPVRLIAIRDISSQELAQEMVRRYTARLHAQHQIDLAILTGQPPLDIARAAFYHLENWVRHTSTFITLYNSELTTAVCMVSSTSYPEPDTTFALNEPIRAYLQPVKEGQSLSITDIATIEPSATEPSALLLSILGIESTQAYLITPLIYKERLIGSLNLLATYPRSFSEEEIEMARGVADQLAIAIENGRLQAETLRYSREMTALLATNKAISTSLDLNTTLGTIAEEAKRLLQGDGSRVHLREADGETLRCVIAIDARADKILAMPISVGQGITGSVVKTGIAELVPNTEFDPRTLQITGTPNSKGTLAISPLITREGIIGAMTVVRFDVSRPFTEPDLRLLNAFADQAAVAIENARLYTQLEKALKQEQTTRAQLIQAGKLSAMGRLVASVAHELNNPLQIIQNSLYLIKRENDLPEMVQKDLDVILRESRRMSDLLGRLRETYRPATKASFRSESLNRLISEVEMLLNTHLRQQKMKFIFEPDETLPLVPALHDQLKQVILNLCLNGVEAMTFGGTLHLKTGQTDGFVFFSVTDTGQGIEPSLLGNIFDPFFTTKEIGTGLGLAITYDIVQQHNGRIEVTSEIGQGSTFTVWLPR